MACRALFLSVITFHLLACTTDQNPLVHIRGPAEMQMMKLKEQSFKEVISKFRKSKERMIMRKVIATREEQE